MIIFLYNLYIFVWIQHFWVLHPNRLIMNCLMNRFQYCFSFQFHYATKLKEKAQQIMNILENIVPFKLSSLVEKNTKNVSCVSFFLGYLFPCNGPRLSAFQFDIQYSAILVLVSCASISLFCEYFPLNP